MPISSSASSSRRRPSTSHHPSSKPTSSTKKKKKITNANTNKKKSPRVLNTSTAAAGAGIKRPSSSKPSGGKFPKKPSSSSSAANRNAPAASVPGIGHSAAPSTTTRIISKTKSNGNYHNNSKKLQQQHHKKISQTSGTGTSKKLSGKKKSPKQKGVKKEPSASLSASPYAASSNSSSSSVTPNASASPKMKASPTAAKSLSPLPPVSTVSSSSNLSPIPSDYNTLHAEHTKLRQKFNSLHQEYLLYKQKYSTMQEDYLSLGNYCKLLKKELKSSEGRYNDLVEKFNSVRPGHVKKEKRLKLDALKKKKVPELSERTVTTQKQSNIISELLTTEQEYVKVLRFIETHFYEPIRHNGLMSEEEQKQIFGDVQMVRQINEMFLQELEYILKDNGDQTSASSNASSSTGTTAIYSWKQYEQVIELVSRQFVSFKLYVGYISKYNTSLMQLNSLISKNKSLRKFIHEAESNLKNAKLRSSRLHSLLVAPVQRPPRYRLLLEQLSKVTDPGSHSHAHLQKALSLIVEICDYLNRQNGQIENSLKMLDLQAQLNLNNLIVPSRKFIAQCATVEKLTASGKKVSRRNGSLYAFNDMLLFVTQGSSMGMLTLKKREVLEIPLFDVPRGEMSPTDGGVAIVSLFQGEEACKQANISPDDVDVKNVLSVVSLKGKSTTTSFQTDDRGKFIGLIRKHEALQGLFEV